MKKFLSIILTIALICGLLPQMQRTVQAETSGDFVYEIVDGGAVITGYKGDAADLEIPDTLDGYQVTAIGDSAFEYCNNLIHVTIPQGVTEIGNSAFWGCKRLQSVRLENGVKCIGSHAFDGCQNLADITIPASVVRFGFETFQDTV